jgi:hypothetical protein
MSVCSPKRRSPLFGFAHYTTLAVICQPIYTNFLFFYEKGAVTFDEIEKARGEKKKVSLSEF